MKILITDFHSGCQIWQAYILKELGHDVKIQSFSGVEKYIEDLSLLENVIGNDIPERINYYSINKKESLHNILTTDETQLLMNFDTVLVSFPPIFIELFHNVTFKKPKILNAGHRLHIRIINDRSFVETLKDEVNKRNIIVASMSHYDTEYIKHYTEIMPIELYPTCLYLPRNIEYNPLREEILIGPVNAGIVYPFESIDHMNIISKSMGFDLVFKKIHDIYPKYNFKDLLNHRAIVLFPYSVFSISMIELYELNIPMFVPSKQLLLLTNLIKDCCLYPYYSSESEMKYMDIPNKESVHKYSPNSYNIEDRSYWLEYSYFYQKKNIIVWEDPLDLFNKLITTNLHEVSNKMKEETAEYQKLQLQNWKSMLNNL
jgi:hypothetical protein